MCTLGNVTRKSEGHGTISIERSIVSTILNSKNYQLSIKIDETRLGNAVLSTSFTKTVANNIEQY